MRSFFHAVVYVSPSIHYPSIMYLSLFIPPAAFHCHLTTVLVHINVHICRCIYATLPAC